MDLTSGTELPTLTITPADDTTQKYAAASGDHNPIHLDDEFARSVGLPGRILHGLWTMAQVARAASGEGGPGSLRRLSVQFRGVGVPEQELIVTTTVREERDGVAVLGAQVEQGGKKIIRDAEAEVRAGG